MKVLFYLHSLCIGGAETVVTEYLLQLKRRDIDVILLVNNYTESYLEKQVVDSGVEVVSIYSRHRNILIRKIYRLILERTEYPYKRMESIIDKYNPDIIHVHTSMDYLAKTRYPAEKIIYTFHSDVKRYLSLLSDINRKTIKKMSLMGMNFIAISKKIEKDVMSIYGTSNIKYIPNGLNIQHIRKYKNSRVKIRRQLHIDDDVFVLGHVGRFNSVKNHERIIEIFEEVHKQKNNSKLLLIGGDENGRIELIKKLAKEKHLNEYVYYLGVRKNAVEIMSAFDAIIIPSFSESFSLAAVEAQALDIKCIASDNLPEEVFCNDNCIRLTLENDNEKWCDAILNNYRMLWKNNIEDFSIATVIDKTISYYYEVLNK